jgi:hypothetical protein
MYSQASERKVQSFAGGRCVAVLSVRLIEKNPD